ncbi:hypothetical protein NUW58_g191 [Xylaria curta]|uniref:Uncharacterized protein n=1 Tax=Xylaria curta TaxID=42375 RepID=A0ACC1PQ61_9PEZI|nr:hypothetical protein NUW58_g191 [Xylaria curta]
MDPQQAQPFRISLRPITPPHLPAIPSRTANSTPVSSPGLFSPTTFRSNPFLPYPASDASTPAAVAGSPFLHPLQTTHKVREKKAPAWAQPFSPAQEIAQHTDRTFHYYRTHKALVDLDLMTGRKLINQYEVIEELGRGVHGKVKLARNLENGENVAIKIIPRFSKTRRLGKVTASPQDKTKREIAILKKIRHPNVVALLEIIDDPELRKIYVVLEHVELGEVIWRKKGLPSICSWERRRVEQVMYGEPNSTDEEEFERYIELREKRRAVTELKRAKMQETHRGPGDYWSIEYGAANEDDWNEPQSSYSFTGDGDLTAQPPTAVPSASYPGSRVGSITRCSSRSAISGSCANTPLPSEFGGSSIDADADAENEETPGAVRSKPGSSAALDGTMYGAYMEDPVFRGRSPSMADSIISHMSSVDFNSPPQDAYTDDFSYVPCFTIDEARATFRDTVLGLEYLHYEGVVHRDIKPANLLWTKDHRVKISDFGVSYFGRPIREGEPELVSESEARDFDDDLELAKTVGTPAFFAPELCYTDVDHKQPKISEQIDVWSLGVTLYCLIFARIPFMAEDEYQMFKKIAKDEVYIPRRRLRPVDPHHSPSSTSLYKRVNSEPYRDDNVIDYEDVDNDLYDLLRQMLTKNPEKRIRLKDVKRHPWVVADITMPVSQWIDETDPSRRFSGRKIEVDEREIKRAVVPLTLMERARSVMKKAVSKVIHGGRTEKQEGHSQSRKRATSSVASSAGETPPSAGAFPLLRDLRRKSIRPEDYFPNFRESEHPLAQSVSATPRDSPTGEPPDFRQPSTPPGGNPHLAANDSSGLFDLLPGSEPPPSSSTSFSSSRGLSHQRHGRVRSVSNAQIALAHAKESQTMPTSSTNDPVASARKTRDVRTQDDPTRSKSVDRGLFANEDKRAEPIVAISTATAPGSIELPTRPLSVDPSYAMIRNKTYRAEELTKHDNTIVSNFMFPIPQPPPSPDAPAENFQPPPRVDTAGTLATSASVSNSTVCTPLTSPSAVASPISIKTLPQQNFRSDPSLPALLSGASSVSADAEGDFLLRPGTLDQPSLIDTTDSLTPPALGKEPVEGFPLRVDEQYETLFSRSPHEVRASTYLPPNVTGDDEDSCGSDSDGGITMAKSRKRVIPREHASAPIFGRIANPKRRDTQNSVTSIGSTETAKKVATAEP